MSIKQKRPEDDMKNDKADKEVAPQPTNDQDYGKNMKMKKAVREAKQNYGKKMKAKKTIREAQRRVKK
jgi:hypothetical protein